MVVIKIKVLIALPEQVF